MDAPPVQYVTTPDGVSLAYAVVGTGFPLVLADSFTTAGIDGRFRSPRSAIFHETLAAKRRVIMFDWRNSGLSGSAADFTLRRYVNDIEEVVNHLGLARFDLWATLGPCKVALEFAALHQPYVRRLILSHPTPRGSSPRTYYGEPMRRLLETDWQSFTDVFALRHYGWTESGRQFVEQVRKNWTQESFGTFMAAVEGYDPSVHAPDLRCESLLIADAEGRSVDVEEARRLAALIPKGRLVLTHLGGSLAGAYDPELARIGDDFLGADPPAEEPEGEAQTVATRGAEMAGRDRLSLREVEVLSLVAAGRSNQQIADELVISLNTVRRHVSNVFDKTGVANRTEASVYARDHGIA